MKAAEAILLLAILAAVVIWGIVWFGSLVIDWWVARRARSTVAHDVWRVEDDKQGQQTVVQLEKSGEEPYYIGSIPISLPHYEYDEALTELRLEAHDKADSLNRRLLEK